MMHINIIPTRRFKIVVTIISICTCFSWMLNTLFYTNKIYPCKISYRTDACLCYILETTLLQNWTIRSSSLPLIRLYIRHYSAFASLFLIWLRQMLIDSVSGLLPLTRCFTLSHSLIEIDIPVENCFLWLFSTSLQ